MPARSLYGERVYLKDSGHGIDGAFAQELGAERVLRGSIDEHLYLLARRRVAVSAEMPAR